MDEDKYWPAWERTQEIKQLSYTGKKKNPKERDMDKFVEAIKSSREPDQYELKFYENGVAQ